jgi:hypothetical protein
MQQCRSALECNWLNEQQAVDPERIQTLLSKPVRVMSKTYAIRETRADGAIAVCWQPLALGICCLMVSQPGQQCMQPKQPDPQVTLDRLFLKPQQLQRNCLVSQQAPYCLKGLADCTTNRMVSYPT